MDFQISASGDGRTGTMQFQKNMDIKTGMWLSISTEKGTFFQDPGFGLTKMTKVTDQDIPLYTGYIEEALDWLLQSGRAKSIDVLVERDLQDVTRLNIKVQATQPNGLIVTYETYQRVI
jgi:phage gp46-like protein